MISLAYFIHCVVFFIVLYTYRFYSRPVFYSPLFIYIVFHFLVFVVRPFLVIYFEFDHGWWYMFYYPSDVAIVKTFFVSSFALLIFYFSFTFSSNNCAPLFNLKHSYGDISKSEVYAFLVLCVLVLPLGIYSTVTTLGGVHSDDVGMEFIDGIRVHTQTTGYVVDAKNMLFSFCIIAIFVFRFKPLSFIFIAIFMFHRAFIGYGRWGIILALISLSVIYLHSKKQYWPSKKIVILIPIVFLLFNILGHNRDAIRGLFEDVTESYNVYESEGFHPLDTLDFANFDYLTFIVDKIPEDTQTYRFGAQYLQLITEPIPRILWADKPLGEPIKFYDLNDYGHFLGLTYSLPGDGWSSGGFIGVFFTMLIFGWLIGKYYLYFCRHLHNINILLMYCIVFPMFIQLYRDGGISIFKFLLFTLAPVFIFNIVKSFIKR